MRPLRTRVLGLVMSLAAGSTCLQLGGCSLEGLAEFATTLNPCGTILACDSAQYRFIMADITEPGVDVSVDPFCTWPPYCSADVDPIFGGVSGLP
jgi:hypothetical protein